LQTGERISVAIKTCKDFTAEVKEKFLSEAGECVAVMISPPGTCDKQEVIYWYCFLT